MYKINYGKRKRNSDKENLLKEYFLDKSSRLSEKKELLELEQKRFILEHIKLQFEEIKNGSSFCQAQKVCRYCKKKTDAQASICPHCGRDIEIKKQMRFRPSRAQRDKILNGKDSSETNEQELEETVIIELEIDKEQGNGNPLFVEGLNKLFIPAEILRTSKLNSILHLIDDYYGTTFQEELFGTQPHLGDMTFPTPDQEQISHIERKMRSFAKVWSTKQCTPEMAEKILELALSDLF